jgi:phage tail P2-like protein
MSGGGMTLQTLEFVRLLPQFMRGDLAVQGLAKALDEIIPDLAVSVERLTTWDRIGEMSESELDALAWELNIAWYDKSADIATKRELVLNSDKVYKSLGTKWAVENVVATYFGDAQVEEWFTYGGEPGHFRVGSSNPSLKTDRYAEFVAVLNKVKRASSKFDGISISLAAEFPIYAGVGVHIAGSEQYIAKITTDRGIFYAIGDGEYISITTSMAFGAEGDSISIATFLPVSTDGDAIIIG